MKKVPFYSYLTSPVKSVEDFYKSGLATHATGFLPLATDLVPVKNLRKKRIYLVSIKSYHNLSVSSIPDFLKNYGLQICRNAPNYLGGLPEGVKSHSCEFDDKYIVALEYPEMAEFRPAREDRQHLSGPLGLMFRESMRSIIVLCDFYRQLNEGKCIILAEKLRG